MKLHLPVSLRACLLALFAVTATSPVAEASYQYTSNQYYYNSHKGSSYDLWDWTWGTTKVVAPNGTSYQKDNILQVKYWDIFSVTSTHNCVFNSSGNCTASTVHTSGYYFKEDGAGKNVTWNCSSENAPGMWILCNASHTTQENPITFTNYGDMVVDGNRQQLVVKKAAKVDNNGNVTEWIYDTRNMVDDSFIISKDSGKSAVKQISMDLLVQDTKSFTYQNAYTGGHGSLGAANSHFIFRNVGELSFVNNESTHDSSGGLVGGESFSFTVDGADNVYFSGNKGKAAIARGYRTSDQSSVSFKDVTDTVKFENHTANNLFYNVNLTFDNVANIEVNESQSRLFSAYNGSSTVAILTLNNVGKVWLHNFNRPEQNGPFFYTENALSQLSVKDVDEFVFENNTYSSCMIYDDNGHYNKFVLDSIGSFNVRNNTVINGRMLSNLELEFNNIGSEVAICENTIGLEGGTASNSVLGRSALTFRGKFETDANGTITSKADSFKIDSNKAIGSYSDGLAEGAINVSYFDKMTISANSYHSTAGNWRFVGALNVEHVDGIEINNNTTTSDSSLVYLVRNVSVNDFKTFEISDNNIKAFRNQGLYEELILETEQADATVTISGNTLASSYAYLNSSGYASKTKLTNVSRFELKDNVKEILDKNQNEESTTCGILGGRKSNDGSLTLTNVATIDISGNKVINRAHNNSGIYGSAINACVVVDQFDSLSVSNNSAIAEGPQSFVSAGAVRLYDADTIFSNGNSLMFRDNLAQADASAIGGAVKNGNSINIKNVKDLSFINNKAVANSETGETSGGALYTESHITFTNVENITFRNNSVTSGASAYGGAVWLEIYNTPFMLTSTGTINFCDNTAVSSYITGVAKGGAFYVTSVNNLEISGAQELNITGNSAIGLMEDKAYGGAIYAECSWVTLKDNDRVNVRGNYVKNGDFVKLQSIYSTRNVSLQAKYQQEVVVHDSIHAGDTIELNNNANMLGSVTLTGANTEEDLRKIKSNATQEEIEASRLYTAKYMNMAAGDVYLEDGVGVNLSYNFTQTGGTLHMKDARIHTNNYVKTTNVEFTGTNEFKTGAGTSVMLTGSNWTFNLSDENKETAVLTLGSTETGKAGFTEVTSLTLASTDELSSGIYKLISFDSAEIQWTSKYYNKTTLKGICTSTAIGQEGENDVYFIIDGTEYTLVYEVPFEERSSAATLTWNAASGTWEQGKGLASNVWSGDVKDTNYYNGDSVIFDGAAEVTLKGFLTPADVKVSNAEDSVVWDGDGQLTGSTKVTKSGEGTLEINTANAYTGGTSIEAGSVKVGNAAALGLGEVSLTGGELDMGGYAVGNDVVVNGTAAIENADASTGALKLQGGELSISSSRKGATTLTGGSLVNAASAATSISQGAVTLGGSSLVGNFKTSGSAGWNVTKNTTITGALTLDGGTLTLNDTSLTVSGVLTLGSASIVLNGDYTAGNEYALISAGSISGDIDSITLEGVSNYTLLSDNNILTLVMNEDEPELEIRTSPTTLTWVAKSGTWAQGQGLEDELWSGNVEDTNYYNGDTVVFDSAAEVSLSGSLTPAAVKVSNEEGSVVWEGEGQLAGGTAVTKTGEGTLEINTANSYTGGTTIKEGTVVVGDSEALGLGSVKLTGGELDMGGYAVENDITVNGTASILNAASSTGELKLQGGELTISSSRKGATTLTGGELVNSSSSATNISKGSVTLGGSSLSGAYTTKGSAGWNVTRNTSIAGSLTLSGGSLTLNDTYLTVSGTLTLGSASIILDGDYTAGNEYTLISAGSIAGNVNAITLVGVTDYTLTTDNNVLTLVMNGGTTEPPTVDPEPPFVDPEPPAVDPGEAAKLTWANVKGAVWKVGQAGWNGGKRFADGDEVTFNSAGTVSVAGTVKPGSITVDCDKNVTFKTTTRVPGAISGDGELVKYGAGTLTLNDGNRNWAGDIYLEEGTLKVKGTTSLGKGTVYVEGGTLNLASKAVNNDIVQTEDAAIKSGKKYTGTYTLSSGELMKGSSINVSKTATLIDGTVNGTLSGMGKVVVDGSVLMGTSGKITTSSLALADDSEFETSSKGLLMGTRANLDMGIYAYFYANGKITANNINMNGSGFYTDYAEKPVAISLKGNLNMENGSVATLNGKLSANNLKMADDAGLYFYDKPQAVSLKGNMSMVNGSEALLTGKLTTGTLSMSDSTILIDSEKPQAITVKGNAALTNSAIGTTGKISTGNLKLTDSAIYMSGGKPQSIKVKGALTLNSGSSIILDYDFAIGKTYKVITFNSISYSGSLYDIFGVSEDDCVLENTGKAITLTVTGYWDPQAVNAVTFGEEGAPLAVDAAQEKKQETDKEPVAIAAVVEEANPVADALVQANWGQLEASRAFVNAIANRSMAVQLGSGERAVWASAIGGSSRHSSAHGHAGADTNISGGAFGLETQVGRASVFGMALGNSWTRVSAHGFDTIKQDTTHLGVYGQTNWRKVSADWSAAYGRSESEVMGSDWNQKHLQLDGRVSYNHALSDRTVLSGFGGMQYYASDSASVNGTDTGSLQNLRAEIGVGARHRVGKLSLYGEAAVHQDIVRHNPHVWMEGARFGGMNQGRTGLNFTVGASYELNDQWSVNASYTGEVVENANAHSANVGATYKF